LINSYGGVNKVAPVLAGFFLFAALSGLALPGLVSFIGEFLVLLGTFQANIALGSIATVGIVITAAYMLRVYQRSMTGPPVPSVQAFTDLKGREILALAPIAVLTIVLGFFPGPVLDVVNPAVEQTLSIFQAGER
jgi:NADH-quinone oxidoreductase subunit M